MIERVGSFFRSIGAPFRAVARVFVWFVNLQPRQMRNLCLIFLLSGIIAISIQDAVYLGIAKQAYRSSELSWVGMLINQMFYNALLKALFCLTIAGIAFGADYLRLKYADAEFGMGKGREPDRRGTDDVSRETPSDEPILEDAS